MSKPRIHVLALGGTIATRPDATGAMQMGLGADDLVAAVPRLAELADVAAETVSRVGSHSLSFDQVHALAARIRSLKVDGVVVTQGTDTLEETGFLLDLLLDLDIPVIVTAAMRNPALTSPDGPGNLLAAVRVACDPWVRRHARALGVMAVMLDEVHAVADVLKAHPTRLDAFVSPQTGPLAALVEDRIVPMSLPVRDAVVAARPRLASLSGQAQPVAQAQSVGPARPVAQAQPVALFWVSLDESGRMIEALIDAPDRLGYRGAVLGAMGGGHLPERMTDTAKRLAGLLPTVVSPRAGGGPMLRQTYGGPSAEIALREAGLIWGGRLHPLKARVLLETCLRAGLDRAAIGEIFDGWG
jgi:L-asparaginase